VCGRKEEEGLKKNMMMGQMTLSLSLSLSLGLAWPQGELKILSVLQVKKTDIEQLNCIYSGGGNQGLSAEAHPARA